jgi:branched-chain amino acid transport system substrate-binding protein
MSEGKSDTSRRNFLKYVATGVVCGVVAGVGGWFAKPVAPAVTETVTETVTTGVLGAVTVTQTLTKTETATVTKTVAAETPAPPRTIKIGATVSLTGKYAPTAAPAKDLYLSWQELINKRGGIYVEEYGQRLPVKVIVYDDKSDTSTVTKFYEKLVVEDKVDVLLGPYGSVLNVPAAVVAEKYGTPIATGPAGAPPIYENKKWVVSVIVLLPDIQKYYFEMITDMAKRGEVKTVSLIAEDTPFGLGLNKGAEVNFPKAGVDVVYKDIVAVGTKDFTPVILKLKEANADIVFVSALAPFAATFVKQAYEQGLHPKGIFCFSVLYKSVLDAVGPAANYYVGWFHWMPSLPYDGLWGKKFWMQVMEKAGFKNEEYPLHVLYYVCLEALCAAIRDAGSLDKAKVMEALRNLNIQSICGPLYFRDLGKYKGVGTLAQYPVQYVDGKYTVLWPPEVATGKYIYPMP